MNVGQIVFIKDSNISVQTGIIVSQEYNQYSGQWWYEVFCNDNQNHVIPGFLLSPAESAGSTKGINLKKYFKNNATLYKTHKIPVTLYT